MTADKDDPYLRTFDPALRSGFEGGHGAGLIGDYSHCRSCQRLVHKGRQTCDSCQKKIDQILDCTTGEEMTQETDRPTTEIKWRDAREEEPDEDSEILIINNDGDIESGKYAQDGSVRDRCKVFKDKHLLREWKNVNFWAPIPDDLPSKDWTLEVLNRQINGWETVEKGEHYALETKIQMHNISITAVKHGVKGAEVTMHIGPEVEIENVQYGPDLTTSFEMALEETIKEMGYVRKRIEKVESALCGV